MSTPIRVERELSGSFRAIHSSVVPVRVLGDSAFDGVSVSAEAHVVELIEATIENGTLWIRPKSDASFSTSVAIEVLLSASNLEAVRAEAGSRVTLSKLRCERLEVSAASGAQIQVCGEVQSLVAIAESGGAIDLSQAATRNVSTRAVSGGRVN